MGETQGIKTIKKNSKSLNLRIFGLALFLLGVFAMFSIRFVTYKNDDIHFHANFALYANGKQDKFDNFTFYEEEASCSTHDHDDLKSRAHMHDENPGLIHVHAHAVTWGQFFANLGYTLGDKVLVTDGGVFSDNQNEKLVFILNGQPVTTIQNRLIHSEDRLLINYGIEDTDAINKRFDSVPSDANVANKTKDPASCSGGADTSLIQRFKAGIGLGSH